MQFFFDRFSVEVTRGPHGGVRVEIGANGNPLVFEDRRDEEQAVLTGARLVAVLGRTTPAHVLASWGFPSAPCSVGGERHG